MAKNQGQFEVACPCCGALLKIDIATRAVIAHTPKAVPKTFDDIEAAACWKKNSRKPSAEPRKRLTPASRSATSTSTEILGESHTPVAGTPRGSGGFTVDLASP